ncbi:hypothetical protein BW1_083_00110 [Bacillus mycoides NBRC 101238 = DSM 11821]|nr:hypothetical protein BW1_083_00110 [Bacillus mycoides NBRC 101238 = DSM 11821]
MFTIIQFFSYQVNLEKEEIRTHTLTESVNSDLKCTSNNDNYVNELSIWAAYCIFA